MANEYEYRGNRQQDHNQSRYGDDRNGRLQGGAGGRYHGTDYEDPRSDFAQAQGAGRGGQWDSSSYAEQNYGPDYSESGGSRRYGGSDDGHNRFAGQRGQGSRNAQTGRFGGYASEDESVYGLNQHAAREFAQEQYGQGLRGQDGQARFGQGGYGGQGRQRGLDRSEGLGQSGYGDNRYGDNRYGDSRYAQGGYGPSPYGQGHRQGGHAQRGGGYSQRPYDQGEYNQSGYGRGDFAQVGFGHGGDPRQGQSLGDDRQRGYGHGTYNQGYAQGDESRGARGGYGQGGYGQGDYGMGGQQGRQSHRGKGPRNYARSDERITEDLNERLMQDDDVDATHINVSVSNGEVTLEGTVEQRWMKHRIEDLAERCSGVKDVENKIRVKRSDDSENDRSGTASHASTNGGKSVSTKANPSTTGTTTNRTNS